jgi:hypothetical protein
MIGHSYYDLKVKDLQNRLVRINSRVARYESMALKMESFRFPQEEVDVVQTMFENASELRDDVALELKNSKRMRDDT